MEEIYTLLDLDKSLPPEVDKSGNIEYKLHLMDKDKKRIEGLSSQMKWRINEGKKKTNMNEAYYIMGVKDNGEIGGIKIEEIQKSLKILNNVCEHCDASIKNTELHCLTDGLVSISKVVRNNTKEYVDEYRIALVGNTGIGKTTLIGVITYNLNDDGNGLARCNVLQHEHEHKSGKTSSIKNEIIGIKNGSYIYYNDYNDYMWENIYKKSDTIVNFIDLPGDRKYSKTTLFGIMSYMPHFVFVVVDGYRINIDKDIDETTKQNIDIITQLEIPILLIITKYDKYEGSVIPIIKKSYNTDMIELSSINRYNIDKLKDYILHLTKKDTDTSDTKLFIINDKIIISDIGLVVSGIVLDGEIDITDKLMIGPFNKKFCEVEIQSIHKKQTPCNSITKDESGSFVINIDKKYMDKVTKHMMIFSSDQMKNFTNKINIIIKGKHVTKIGSQYAIYMYNSIDTCIIKNIKYDNNITILTIKLRKTNIVRYIKNNANIILRDSHSIYIGKATFN